MNRRTALKNFIIVSGALLVFPSCLRPNGKSSTLFSNLSISQEQEELQEALVESLIPKTDSPGGKELQLHLFVFKMVNDCHSEAEQLVFMDGMKAFEQASEKALGGPFVAASLEKREAYLSGIGQEKEDPEMPLTTFYKITKRRTIQGYMNAEYVMRNLVKYELVPGRYNGYMPV